MDNPSGLTTGDHPPACALLGWYLGPGARLLCECDYVNLGLSSGIALLVRAAEVWGGP